VNKAASPTKPRRPRSKKPLYLVILAVAAAVGWIVYNGVTAPTVEVFSARQGKVVSAVYGTVIVEYDYTRSLRAENQGYIEFREGIASGRISEGMPVTKGMLLAKVIDEITESRLRQNRINLEAARETEKLGPPSQQLLVTTKDTLDRLERLSERTRTVPAADLERARNEYKRLQEAVRIEQIELDRSIQTLEQDLQLLERDATKNSILSPIDGILNKVNVSDGDLVSANSDIFQVARSGMHIVGEVNEEDVGLLKTGMPAVVKLYSYGIKEFPAVLDRVLPTGDNQRYSTILRLLEPPDNLKAGMTGEMNVYVGQQENAVYIPTRAVLIDQVLVIEDGAVRQRTVKSGFRNLEFVEIVSGIMKGDLVVLADQDLLRPAQKVRTTLANPDAITTDP